MKLGITMLLALRLNVVLPKSESLCMVLLALALHALSAYFGVVIYNTGCGRKPQNKCSITLLAPIDIGKSFILLLISNAQVSSRNEVCKRYANLFAHRIGVVFVSAILFDMSEAPRMAQTSQIGAQTSGCGPHLLNAAAVWSDDVIIGKI